MSNHAQNFLEQLYFFRQDMTPDPDSQTFKDLDQLLQ